MDIRKMEIFAADQSPFRETIDTQRFFPGARRREVLEELKSAINESVALLTLTGEEGCGKTMICRMIEKELPEGYLLVFFPHMLDSFEDVTRSIAQEMRITLADGVAVGDIRDLLLEVWERLAERKQRMLIVFDQAERIYLATLERIRKMLDIMNQTGIVFQILFSGRNELLDNLQHLSMCSFKGAEERRFILEPLDVSATHGYLNFCLNGGKNGEGEVFTPEESEKIFMIAGGNIRMTNDQAEESLQSMTVDTSVKVLLDKVQDTKKKERPRRQNPPSFQDKYSTYKKWVFLVGISLIVLVFLMIIWKERSLNVHQKKSAMEVEQLSSELENIQKKAEEIKVKTSRTDAGQPPASEKEALSREEPQTAQMLSSSTLEGIPEKKQAVEKNIEAAPVESMDNAQKVTRPEPPIPEKAPVDKISVDQLFNTRIAMAAKWLVGEKNDHYTVQLMVLTSEGAENNLKKMLAQKEYQEVADRLFILRRVASVPSVLVFYGEYSNIVDARNARNTLPAFLLKRNPYAISVRGAVEKANGN
jgi:type II secretory pathway predicted ATPase ExeA